MTGFLSGINYPLKKSKKFFVNTLLPKIVHLHIRHIQDIADTLVTALWTSTKLPYFFTGD